LICSLNIRYTETDMGVLPRLRNGKTVAFRVLGKFATLCLLGLGLGLGLGHAWVALG